MKYPKSTTLDCKDIGIWKSKFVAMKNHELIFDWKRIKPIQILTEIFYLKRIKPIKILTETFYLKRIKPIKNITLDW